MNDRRLCAFTIMELIISVMIIGMIFVFSFEVFNNTKANQNNISRSIQKNSTDSMKIKLIYMDIVNARNKFEIDNKYNQDLDILYFQTTNSMYKRDYSFVVYKVVDEKLYRIESSNKLRDDRFGMKKDIDMLFEDVEIFKVYENNSKKKTKTNKSKLVFVKTKTNTIRFEVASI